MKIKYNIAVHEINFYHVSDNRNRNNKQKQPHVFHESNYQH